MTRPTTSYGDHGSFVKEIQSCLEIPDDGDFGRQTENAVRTFQTAQRLDSDGVVGPKTWDKFEEIYNLPPYPTPLPPSLPQNINAAITELAMNSTIARYDWRDRGVAPTGYTKGMALAWSTVYRKFLKGDPSALEMAKANTGNADLDALAWYAEIFRDNGMNNNLAGTDTLRHLFVLLMGLGMRESSGQHCCGRDMSASNVQSDTAEAGLFQTSWNINTCSDQIQHVFDQYNANRSGLCALATFSENVQCDANNWGCYGSGEGFVYQELAKICPQFAVESTAIGLRNRRQHWGPINRYEAEVMPEADALFQAIQDLLAGEV